MALKGIHNIMGNPIEDVPQDSSPVASESVNTQSSQLPVAPVVTTSDATQPTGSKTPEENLYAALAEERRMRKQAEDKLNQFNTTTSFEPEVISDEAKILKGHIDTLSDKIHQLEDDKALEKLFIQYPVLKENLDKFNDFRQAEHPRAKIESVAKIYLAENGLLERPRVGLENPTGGDRAPMSQGMTADDIANLRKNNWKKYQELLSKGLIKMDA